MTLDGDFTIHFWAHSHDLISTQTFFGSHDPNSGADGNQGLELERFNVAGSETFFLLRTEQGNYSLTVPVATDSTNWFHYALVRNSGSIRLYVNGVPNNFAVSNNSTFNHGSYGIFYIGASPRNWTQQSPVFINYFNGHIDEFIIINGEGAWSQDFSNSLPSEELDAAGCEYEGCTPCQTTPGCTQSWADNYDPNAAVDNGSCYKLGCMETWADNYDSQATIEDNSCTRAGCTYDWADNYDPLATTENGSCVLQGCNQLWADNYDPNATLDDGSCFKEGCTQTWADNYDSVSTIDDGSCYKFACTQTWADNYDASATNDDGTCYLYGCTETWADNFNTLATNDDGSCILSACTQSWAENYDPNATSDDGSCYKHGCMESWADNYDPQATIPTDTCYKYGCTQTWADNYDANATIDDGSCGKAGCTYDWADNYDSGATIDDGSCTLAGCTDPLMSNYDPNATSDDGSCVLGACTEDWADNYVSYATYDDGSCFKCGCMEQFADNYDPFATVGQGDGGYGGDCYFQGIFHFDGNDGKLIDETALSQGGWDNLGTDYTAKWTVGWGLPELDTAYKAFGTSSFKSGSGSAILTGSAELLDWEAEFTIDMKFAATAGASNVGSEAYLIGGEGGEEGGTKFSVYFRQESATRQTIRVSTGLETESTNADIFFDSSTSTITGNMVSMPILDGTTPGWQHLAVTRDDLSILRLYIDGILYGSSLVEGTIFNQASGLEIGGSEQANLSTNWVDELRIHNAVDHSVVDDDGLYTFLVPTAQYSHAGTCYKIGCTQSWGDNFDSLATRDSSVALFTNSGSSIDPVELVANAGGALPVIGPQAPKFGVGSVHLDGNLEHVFIQPSDTIDFGTEDFTIDLWVRFDDVTRDYDGILTVEDGEWIDTYSSVFDLTRSTSGSTQTLSWSFSNRGSSGGSYTTDAASGNYAFQNDIWYHIAIVKTESGQYLRLYLDGVLLGEYAEGDSYADRHYTGRYNTGGLIFGATYSSTSYASTGWSSGLSRGLKGYIDEVRVTKGENKYPYGNFTLETDEYCKDQTAIGCIEVEDGALTTPTSEEFGVTGVSTTPYKWHGFMFDVTNNSNYDIVIGPDFSILGDEHEAGFVWPGGISVYYIQPSKTLNTKFDTSVNIDGGVLGDWVLLGTDTDVVSQGDWASGILTPINIGEGNTFNLPAGYRTSLYITALDQYDIGGFKCDGESGCLGVGEQYAYDDYLIVHAGKSHNYNNTNSYPDPDGSGQSRLFRGTIGYTLNCQSQCWTAPYIFHFDTLPCFKYGCMGSWADNYDSFATIDDGSCYKNGCIEEWASNFDHHATIDDGSCMLSGCASSWADNYNPDVTHHDPSSCYKYGCTESTASNYNSEATTNSLVDMYRNTGNSKAISRGAASNAYEMPTSDIVDYKFADGSIKLESTSGPIAAGIVIEGHEDVHFDIGEEFTIDMWVKFPSGYDQKRYIMGPAGLTVDDDVRNSFILYAELENASINDRIVIKHHSNDVWQETPYDDVPPGNADPGNTGWHSYSYAYLEGVSTTVTTGWHHIALTRDTSNEIRFFFDGVFIPWTIDTAYSASQNTYALVFDGAVINNAIAIPSDGEILTDFSEKVTELVGSGADIVLNFNNSLDNDGVGNAVWSATTPGIYNGAPTYDANNKKFGSHSLRFDTSDGSGDFVVIPYNSDIAWSATGEFTFDFWFKITEQTANSTGRVTIFSSRPHGSSSSDPQGYHPHYEMGYYGKNYPTSARRGNIYVRMVMEWSYHANSYVEVDSSVSGIFDIVNPTEGHDNGYTYTDLQNDFHNVALVRSTAPNDSGGAWAVNGGVRLYFNGVEKVQIYDHAYNLTAYTTSIPLYSDDLVLGRHAYVYDDVQLDEGGHGGTSSPYGLGEEEITTRDFDGWIDRFRVWDRAVWIGNFSPYIGERLQGGWFLGGHTVAKHSGGTPHSSKLTYMSIDEFRLQKGVNAYPTDGSGFALPTESYGAIASGVCPSNVALWHLNTDFTDTTHGITITAHSYANTYNEFLDIPGYAQIISETAPPYLETRVNFGKGVAKLTPTYDASANDWYGSYLTIPSTPAITDWAGDYTIEFWIRFDDVSTTGGATTRTEASYIGRQPIIQTKPPSSSYTDIGFILQYINQDYNSNYNLFTYVGPDADDDFTAYISNHPDFNELQDNVWYHIALTRSYRTTRFYLNGYKLGEDTASDGPSIMQNGSDIWIGREYYTNSYFGGGSIDEIKITNGEARYTGASFIVPTEQGECSYSPTPFLLHFDDEQCRLAGCTQAWADNYNEIASEDDGSCYKNGCTNSNSDNFDFFATNDDGSCYRNGCTDSTKFGYDSLATVDDGTCLDIVYGCLDPDYAEFVGEPIEFLIDGFEGVIGGVPTSSVQWTFADEPLADGYLPSEWSITGGYMQETSNVNQSSPGTWDALSISRMDGTIAYVSGDDNLTNEPSIYNVQFDVKMKSTDDDFLGLMVRYDSTNNYYYYLEFGLGHDSGTGYRSIRVHRRDANGWTLLGDTGYGVGIFENTWYDIRFTFDDDTFTVLLDNVEVLTGTDPGTPLPAGTVGFKNRGNESSYWDDMVVTNLGYTLMPNTSCINGTEGGGCTPCAIIYGCTDSTQDNYNANATDDDGSCYKYGCTESWADNYDTDATINFPQALINNGITSNSMSFKHREGGNDPIISTTNPKFGGSSLRFDGTGGYVHFEPHNDLSLEGDFTIDFWVKLDSLPSHTFVPSRTPSEHIYHNKGLFSTMGFSGDSDLFIYFADLASHGNTAEIHLVASPVEMQTHATVSSEHYISSDVTASIDTTSWHHIAVTRDDSNTLRLFFNGVFSGSYLAATEIFNSPDGWMLGAYSDADPAKSLDGKIDEFRYMKAKNLYPTDGSDFSAETSEYPSFGTLDACDINTAVWHFDSATGLVDSGPNAVAAYTDSAGTGVVGINTDDGQGDPNIDRSAFNSACLELKPSLGTYNHWQRNQLKIPYNENVLKWDANEDLTIDLWVRFDNPRMSANTRGGSKQPILMTQSNQTFLLMYAAEDNAFFTGPMSYSAYAAIHYHYNHYRIRNHPDMDYLEKDTWYHLAYVRSNNKVSIYLNGHSLGSTTHDSALNSSEYLRVGGYYNQSYDYVFSGYIDELRISKGKALWTQNFDVPAGPTSCAHVPNVLLHFDGNIPCFKDGCTETWGDNYDAEATIDDGTCAASGCMDPWEDNFNPYATTDDGSCASTTGICSEGVVWQFNNAEPSGSKIGEAKIVNSGTADLKFRYASWDDGKGMVLDSTIAGPIGGYGAPVFAPANLSEDIDYPDELAWTTHLTSYIQIQDHPDLRLPGEFVIDFWWKPDDIDAVSYFFAPMYGNSSGLRIRYTARYNWSSGSGYYITRYWSINYSLNEGAGYPSTNSLDFLIADHGITVDTWHHIALVRDSLYNVMFFVDGVIKMGEWTEYDENGNLYINPYLSLANFGSSGVGWAIGRDEYGGTIQNPSGGSGTSYGAFNGGPYDPDHEHSPQAGTAAYGIYGSIKEFRILKGSDNGWEQTGFTPPTAPYTIPDNVVDGTGSLYLRFEANDSYSNKVTKVLNDTSKNPELAITIPRTSYDTNQNLPEISNINHLAGETMDDFGHSALRFVKQTGTGVYGYYSDSTLLLTSSTDYDDIRSYAALNIPEHSSITIGQDDFTIDFWARFDGNENSLILHFDNNLTDSAGKHSPATTGTNNNGPAFVTDSQIGTHSASFDSTDNIGDFIVIPYTSELTWEDTFTVDFWFKFTNETIWTNPKTNLVSMDGFEIDYHGGQWTGGEISGDSGWARTFKVSMTVGSTSYSYDDWGVYEHSVSDQQLLITWHHLAVVRTGNEAGGVKLYLDGTALSIINTSNSGDLESQYTHAVNSGGSDLVIGRKHNVSYDTVLDDLDFNGQIDEFRITKHAAWISDFNPPTASYTTDHIIAHNHIIKSLNTRQAGSNASTDDYGTLQISIKSEDTIILVGGYYNPNITNAVAEWHPSGMPALSVDTWYHFALTRTGDVNGSADNLGYQQLKFYVDGTLIDTQTLDDTNTEWITGGSENRVGNVEAGFSLGYTGIHDPGPFDASAANSIPGPDTQVGVLPYTGYSGYLDELRIVKGSAETTFSTSAEYACNEPLTNVCLADWSLYHFNDSAATNGDTLTTAALVDAGPGNYDATISGDPKISTTDVMGGFGFSCADLDGNDHISIPYTALIDTGTNFSIDFWVKFDDLSADISILHMDTSADDEDLHIKYVQSTSEIWFGWNAHNGTEGFVEIPVALYTGVWYHFAATRGVSSGTSIEFYINGELKAFDVATTVAGPSNNALIFGSNLNGFIDEIRIIRFPTGSPAPFTVKPVKQYICNE